MMARRVAAAVVAGMLAFGAAACGGDTGPADGTTEVRYAWWGSGQRNELTQAVVDQFMAANPGIRVVGEPAEFNSHFEKLTVQGAAREAPCIPQMQNRYFAEYATRNQLLALDELIGSGAIDISGIPEVVLDAGRFDGEQFMVPTGIFYYTGYYNADMVAAAGLPTPNADWTWTEWEAWLRAAQPALPDGVTAGDIYNATDLTGLFQNYVVSHGQSLFGDGALGFDRQLLVDWFELWNGLQADGIVLPASTLGERGVSIEELPIVIGDVLWNAAPDNQLAQVNVNTSKNGTGTIAMDKLPNGPAGSGEALGASGLAIAANCEDAERDAAARFVDFFVNDERAAATYASNNGSVSVTSLQDAQMSNPETSPDVVRQLELLQTVIERYDPSTYVSPIGGRQATEAFTRISTSVFLGETSPGAGADAFLAEANRALAAGAR